MTGEMALPVFVSNGVYSPKPLQFGIVEFTPQGDKVVQTKEIKQGFISVPPGSHIHTIVADTTQHTLNITAELGATICIPSSI